MPAALCNALEDALRPLGVLVDATPLTTERIWAAMGGRARRPAGLGQEPAIQAHP